MAYHRSHAKWLSTTSVRLLLGTIISIFVSSPTIHAQGLSELMKSEAMQEVARATQKDNRASIGNADPDSNFALLWKKGNSQMILATWLGVQMAGFKIVTQSAGLFAEYAGARIALANSDRVRVSIDIQIPRDSYVPMAQLKTLQSFNRFRPPALDVIAQQVVPIQGIDANYYRTRAGSCSLLFDVERFGIVNLKVDRCIDSKVMMEIANNLTFSRLNQKLQS